MDLRRLRHFLAVVEHGSILRAADAIHLTQPALSRSIQTLESEVGVRLLERGRRGIEPSPHGLLLAREARRVLAQADEALAIVRGLDANGPARLALGVGTHLAGFVVPQVVAKLLRELPRLEVRVVDGSAEELIELLQRGELDAVLCAFPAEGAPPGLEFEELLRSDLAVVCRVAHPLARRRRAVALAELAARRWALAERPRAIGQVLRLGFAAAGLTLPEPAVRSTSLVFLLALLEQDNLVSFLPGGYVQEALRERRLVRLRTDLPPATARVGVLRRAGDGAPATRSFIEALRAELRRMRPPGAS